MNQDPFATVHVAMPENHVIRKRVLARTIAIHLCALPTELRLPNIVKATAGNGYLHKRGIPKLVRVANSQGRVKTLSREDVWTLADKAGTELEESLLSGKGGKVAGLFSSTGQGVYANYGRPTVDFSGFFRDYYKGVAQVILGPLLIGADTAFASGLTALGHKARGAHLTDTAVLTDIMSNGAYEGSSAWTAAKIGVAAAAKAIGITAVLPIPGAQPASIVVAFVVGAAAAIATKWGTNTIRDRAVDAAYDAADRAPNRDEARRGDRRVCDMA